jgi:hypothetical protein
MVSIPTQFIYLSSLMFSDEDSFTDTRFTAPPISKEKEDLLGKSKTN